MTQEAGVKDAVDSPKNDHEEFSNSTVVETDNENQEIEVESNDSEESHEEDDQSEADKPKRRGGFQKKIERLQEENARLRALTEQSKPPFKESDSAPAKKPLQNDFTDYDDYVEALTDWKAEQAAEKKMAERDAKSAQDASQKEFEKKKSRFKEQFDKASETYEDFAEAIAEFDDVPVNPSIHAALLDSDMGAEVAYYLAKNPEEFDKLNAQGMGLVAVNRAIGRIEAKIELSKKSGEKAAVKTTKAPPPIEPVKNRASTANSPAAAAERGDYEAYRKARGLN